MNQQEETTNTPPPRIVASCKHEWMDYKWTVGEMSRVLEKVICKFCLEVQEV